MQILCQSAKAENRWFLASDDRVMEDSSIVSDSRNGLCAYDLVEEVKIYLRNLKWKSEKVPMMSCVWRKYLGQ